MHEPQSRSLEVIGLQRRPYREALEAQRQLLERCLASGGRQNFLMLAEHPAVITVGRSADAGEVLADAAALKARGVDVVQTNRGGRVTFHGPGQLVAYPILDLTARGRDLHRYMRDLEGWLIRLLAAYGIKAAARPQQTGVWAADAKIASIGIAVRRWVAYHGVALNVTTDLEFFRLIIPCGLRGVRMTSMAEALGRPVDLADVACRAAEMFSDDFGFAAPQALRSEKAGLA